MRFWPLQSIGFPLRRNPQIFLLLAALGGMLAKPVLAGQVAIIIDDIGYRHTDSKVLSLPASVTLSILPHTKIGSDIATQAHHNGHDIMVHLPMQALNGKALGLGGLTNHMDEEQIRRSIKASVGSVPHAIGVNNHMGSLLTQLAEPMTWLMQELKQHDLFFVDSNTTRFSKAAQKAEQQGIPLLTRQIFLDNQLDNASLERQFKHLMQLSHSQGYAVMIAHPHPETVRFLRNNLQRLESEGISLVPVSSLLPYKLALTQQDKPSS